MAQEHTVSFKVFLQSGGVNEVRRFGIDRDVVSSCTYLREKLRAVFPSLHGRDFTVAWRDSDGDEIVISSDEELMIALSELQTEVRKLYVTVRDGPAQQHDEGQHQLHVGVKCDGCEKQVEGFRYKCIQCPDFDLCATCESKGLHSDHCMIRLPVPISWRHHFGKRLAHHLAKASHRSGSCSGWESKAGHGPCRHGSWKHHGGKHNGEPNWLETLATYLSEWTNLPGEEDPQTKKDTAGPSSSKEQESEEQMEDVHVQYLRNIGQTVAKVLDPLGIDVDIEVRSKNKDDKRGNAPKECNNKDGKNGSEEEHTSAMEVDDKHNNEANAATSERASPDAEGWTVVNDTTANCVVNDTTANQSNVTPNPSAIAAKVPGPETGAVPKQLATATVPVVPPFSNNSLYPNAYALPHHGPLQPVPASFFPNPLPMPFAAATVPNPFPQQEFIHHPPMKPYIADAVNKMMSMGFSNDGGWLTQLLVSKDGDIDKALDVLQPVKKP